MKKIIWICSILLLLICWALLCSTYQPKSFLGRKTLQAGESFRFEILTRECELLLKISKTDSRKKYWHGSWEKYLDQKGRVLEVKCPETAEYGCEFSYIERLE